MCGAQGSFRLSRVPEAWEAVWTGRFSGLYVHGKDALMLEPVYFQSAWVSPRCHWQCRAYSYTRILAISLSHSILYFFPRIFPPPLCVSGIYMSTGVIKCRVACGVHASVLLQRKDFLQEKKNDHFQYFAGCPSKPIIAWHLHTKGKDPANLWVGTMPSEQMGMEVGSQ